MAAVREFVKGLPAVLALGAIAAAFDPDEHWAYRPPVPGLETSIDALVEARLVEHGLAFSPAADPETLLRRVSLDLTGLPPTVEELDAFLADGSPDAYERAVDRLLASPAYGEHQARDWLDLARYADSHGYEKDDAAHHAWRYRDWVIDAFNRRYAVRSSSRSNSSRGTCLPGCDARAAVSRRASTATRW